MGIRKLSLLSAVAAIALLPPLGADAKDAKVVGLAVANLQANFFNQIKESVEAAGAEKGVKVITVDAQRRCGDAGEPDPGSPRAKHRRADLHPRRRHSGVR